jgi:hypothetical protein
MNMYPLQHIFKGASIVTRQLVAIGCILCVGFSSFTAHAGNTTTINRIANNGNVNTNFLYSDIYSCIVVDKAQGTRIKAQGHQSQGTRTRVQEPGMI